MHMRAGRAPGRPHERDRLALSLPGELRAAEAEPQRPAPAGLGY